MQDPNHLLVALTYLIDTAYVRGEFNLLAAKWFNWHSHPLETAVVHNLYSSEWKLFLFDQH